MTHDLAERTVPAFLALIEERMRTAHARAKAASACADGGDRDGAVEIALDIEVLTHEANALLNAASLINRLAREHA